MKHGEITGQPGQPDNDEFSDIYFSRENGIAETEYVFFKQNHLSERWQGKAAFVIAETGFGCGLNFLTTVQQWLQDRNVPPEACLHYISIEKFPLTRKDLQQALSLWPQLKTLIFELIAHYPPAVPGFHHIPLFNHRVVLTLIFAEVETGLKQMRAQVDTWYLDSFAPHKNPGMWTKPVFKEIARLSKKGTRFSTFTAAELVRRGLSEVGFDVEKVKDHAKKREILRGTYVKKIVSQVKHPWFESPQLKHNIKHAIVVGGGIAGVTTAWALAQRGWQIDLIEQREHIAQEGSGNPISLLMPRISLDNNIESQFYAAAFFKTIRHLTIFNHENSEINWNQSGVLQLASSDRIKKQIKHLQCDPDFAQAVSAFQASKIAGIEIQDDALYFPMAGSLNPVALCVHLIKSIAGQIKLHLKTQVHHILSDEVHWQTYDEEHQLIASSETLILANALQAKRFGACDWLPLSAARGQISFVPATAASKNIGCPICFGGYLLPETKGEHLVGASLMRGDEKTDLRQADQDHNLRQLNQHLPTVFDRQKQKLNGRASLRALTPDRMPIVGAVPDQHFFNTQYHDLHKGQPAATYPKAHYLKGLYINAGHGTKGFTSSFLSAELIASQLNDEPLPVPIKIQQALLPARFIIRAYKKLKVPH